MNWLNGESMQYNFFAKQKIKIPFLERIHQNVVEIRRSGTPDQARWKIQEDYLSRFFNNVLKFEWRNVSRVWILELCANLNLCCAHWENRWTRAVIKASHLYNFIYEIVESNLMLFPELIVAYSLDWKFLLKIEMSYLWNYGHSLIWELPTL